MRVFILDSEKRFSPDIRPLIPLSYWFRFDKSKPLATQSDPPKEPDLLELAKRGGL